MSGRSSRPLVVWAGVVAVAAAGLWWWLIAMPQRDARLHEAGSPWFEEVAVASGLAFRHERGPQRYLFPEIMSGGAGLLDYDGDGDLDAYMVQGGDLMPSGSAVAGNRLYRNRGDGTFEEVTVAAGTGDTGYGMGCTAGDYDGDGNTDLYVTNVGPNVLYRNRGDGTFEDVTDAAGVGHPGWGTSCAFVDYDTDGDLDLIVVNYVRWSIAVERECSGRGGGRDYCKPNNYNAPAPDTLYRNNGDGTFTDVSEPAGLRRAFGNGLGVACADYDLDGLPDIYVANDGMPNQLWINLGDGRFEDRALLAGCAVNRQGMAEAGMGVAAVDLDHDGDPDLFMTHLRDETNTFYRNDGGVFEDTSALTRLGAPSIPDTGFGMGFADFDHDGRLDLYVANGRVGRWDPTPNPADPYGERDQLYRGLDADRFEPVGSSGSNDIDNSRAAAFGDCDNDGDIDILVVSNAGPVRLLRNEAGRSGHWVVFRVVNRAGSDALGATVQLQAGQRLQRRLVQSAYSYCASNDPRVHFGLAGETEVTSVIVGWPDGTQEAFGPFAADAIHELRRGAGRPPVGEPMRQGRTQRSRRGRGHARRALAGAS